MEWALASQRGRGVAANTIERELGDVGLAEEWFRKEGLSLADPLAFVELFTPNRIEASLRPWLERDFSRRKVVKIAVGSSEIKMRLDTIGEYVDWVLRDAQSALSVRTQPAQVLAFSRQRDTIAAALKDVTPSRSPAPNKEGLSDQQVHALLDLIDPGSPLCPWGRGDPNNVAAIRAWYSWCADYLQDIGFDPDYAYQLELLRIPGNEKGTAVRTDDPEAGPLNDAEQILLRHAIQDDDSEAFEHIQGRVALWLALAFGRNPANFIQIREEDRCDARHMCAWRSIAIVLPLNPRG